MDCPAQCAARQFDAPRSGRASRAACPGIGTRAQVTDAQAQAAAEEAAGSEDKVMSVANWMGALLNPDSMSGIGHFRDASLRGLAASRSTSKTVRTTWATHDTNMQKPISARPDNVR
jgi:hypothetical protein